MRVLVRACFSSQEVHSCFNCPQGCTPISIHKNTCICHTLIALISSHWGRGAGSGVGDVSRTAPCLALRRQMYSFGWRTASAPTKGNIPNIEWCTARTHSHGINILSHSRKTRRWCTVGACTRIGIRSHGWRESARAYSCRVSTRSHIWRTASVCSRRSIASSRWSTAGPSTSGSTSCSRPRHLTTGTGSICHSCILCLIGRAAFLICSVCAALD